MKKLLRFYITTKNKWTIKLVKKKIRIKNINIKNILIIFFLKKIKKKNKS